MLENVSVGYALGMVEGYLEARVAAGDQAAEQVLEYLKGIEAAYIEKNRVILEQETKLNSIQMKLQGWVKADTIKRVMGQE